MKNTVSSIVRGTLLVEKAGVSLKGSFYTKEKLELPLAIGREIMVQWPEHQVVRIKSTVLGSRKKDFIITEPLLYRLNDRLFYRPFGTIECHYFNEGELYEFTSQVIKHFSEGFTLIAYPETFSVTTLRKHVRIRVNIETRLQTSERENPILGNMIDISERGCQLIFPQIHVIPKNTRCRLSFVLPDNTQVEKVVGVVRNIKVRRIARQTTIGFHLVGPDEEMKKIASFCHFCMFFDV